MIRYNIKFWILCLCLYSCNSKSNDPAPDVRQQAVGTYTGEMVTIVTATDGTSSASSDRTDPVKITVSLSNSNSNAIDIIITSTGSIQGITSVKGTGITSAGSTGFYFNLEDRNVAITTGIAKYKGADHIEVGSSKYDGIYYSSSKTIELKYNITNQFGPISNTGTQTIKGTK